MISNLPALTPVRQMFPKRPQVDLSDVIPASLEGFRSQLPDGGWVAIGVGSRGITGYRDMLFLVLRTLESWGVKPFLFPAMGSHGGGTDVGQREVLASYGITEESMGCEIRCSMEVEEIGTTTQGISVVCSQEALRADGILLVNRIKPHTDFFGSIGSGLVKMSVVGLGKQVGATRFHLAAMKLGYEEALLSLADTMRHHTRLLGGIALLEGEWHQTVEIHAVQASEMVSRERELLAKAKAMMATLPFDTIDLLIIDRIGKDISGAGLDPNVTQRSIHGYSSLPIPPDERRPFIKRIYVRDLTDATHGNAIGIGMADVVSNRLLSKLDRAKTVRNALTALTPQSAKIPIAMDSDREAIESMLASLPIDDVRTARVVRIANTLEIGEMAISESLLEEALLAGKVERSSTVWPALDG